MKPCIFVCETCRFSAGSVLNGAGRTGGEQLWHAVVRAAGASPRAKEFEVRRTRCLMACDQHCNVHLRAPGKITYVAGRFAPTDESAGAIVEYFEKYLQSETGQVPYRSWPAGMKGHFISRTPPFDEQ